MRLFRSRIESSIQSPENCKCRSSSGPNEASDTYRAKVFIAPVVILLFRRLQKHYRNANTLFVQVLRRRIAHACRVTRSESAGVRQ